MATIELDTVWGESDDEQTIEQTCDKLVAGRELTYTVVTRRGPGGGWPIIRFDGEEAAIVELMRTAYGFEDDDIADWGFDPTAAA